ncbi:hypothetical protein [Endozoicomonas sp. ONNA2]|uniref:hypothetical protein n=1 Tax=Endozoicomonas sp. ONNA2 TaxID=2828741 RepID=UPI0021480C48|nr:hypothetical protein [Endozoicomonas sp. ONNA2]
MIIEDAVSIDDIASKLNIPVDQIRRVGHYFLPGHHYVSPDYFLSDLSKTVHRAVFMDGGIMYEESHIIQFLNVVQKVHDEGLKLVVITSNPLLLLENVQECLETNFCLQEEKPRITDRLEHMFRLFSKSSLTGTTNRS